MNKIIKNTLLKIASFLLNKLHNLLHLWLQCKPLPDSMINSRKVNIAVFLDFPYAYAGIYTLIRSITQNDRFNLLIIYHKSSLFTEEENLNFLNFLKKNKVNYQLSSEASIARLDYLVRVRPFDALIPFKYRSAALRILGVRLIYYPYGIMLLGGSRNFKNFSFPIHNLAYKVISQSDDYKYMFFRYGACCGKNVVTAGNPMVDYVMEKANKSLAPESDLFIFRQSHSKIILWITHHSADSSNANASFERYCNQIISFMLKNPNYGLIFRPHPFLKNRICHSKENEPAHTLDLLQAYDLLTSKKIPNVYYDQSYDFVESFNASDLAISDLTSLLPLYALTQKPVVLLSSKNTPDVHVGFESFISNFEIVHRWIDVESFMSGTLVLRKSKEKLHENLTQFLGIDERLSAERIIDLMK